MIRRVCIVLLLLVVSASGVSAQQLSESYYAENPQEDVDLIDEADTLLFYTPYVRQPRFERMARYSLYYAGFSRRGDESAESIRVGNVALNSPVVRYGDWVTTSLLRRVPSVQSYHYSTSLSHESLGVRGESFDVGLGALSQESRARGYYSGRNYRLGGDYRTVGTIEESELRYSLATGARVGGDANVEGAYSNQAYLWGAIERAERENDWGYVERLMAAVMIPYSQRAPRSWNAQELFDLTSNPLYNSNWGYQSGRVRPARVKRECVPMVYLSWRLTDRYDLSEDLAVELLARAGRYGSTSLDWRDAPNPLPDHYTQLPSYYSDPLLADQVGDVWRRGEQQYTQINWPMLYDINRLSSDGAVYSLMDEREDVRSLVLNFSTGKGRELWSREELPNPDSPSRSRLNIFLSYHSNRPYNTPYDLLGAEQLGAWDERLYNYRIGRSSLGGNYGFSFATDYGTFGLGGQMELYGLRYDNVAEGYELRSENLFDLSVKGVWYSQQGWNNSVGAMVRYDYRSPFWEDIFATGQSDVTINPYAVGEQQLAGEWWGEWSLGRVALSANLYANYGWNRASVRHFWNDVAKSYCSFIAGGVDRLSVGAELSAGVPLGGGFEAEAIVALGTSRHLSSAVADIVEFEGGDVVARGFECDIAGLRASSSPEVAVAMRLEGELWGGWVMTLEGALCAGRYVEPSLYYHSDYLHSLNLSPEERAQLTRQESLGVAPNFNIMVRKYFDQLSLSISARNLLGGGRTLYGGYQPMRLVVRQRDNAESYTPHPTRYQYTYPPYLQISVGYDF